MNKRYWIVAAVGVVALSLIAPDAFAQAADQTQQRFNGIIDQFRSQSALWQGALLRSARWLFFALALIQFTWTNMALALKGGDVSDFISVNTKQVLSIGIMWVFLEHAYQWSYAFVRGFLHAGDMAVSASAPGSAGALDPAGVFQNGLVVAGSLFAQMGIWSGADNVSLVICALVLLICFAFLAGYMAVVLVEAYIIIGGSTLLLAFGGSQWTSDIAKKAMFYVISVGAKLFVLQLIVGVAMGSVITWSQTYESDSSTDTLSLIGLVLLITMCAKMIPELVQSMLSGVSTGGTGAMMSTIAAAGAAAIAGGAALGAAGGGGAAGATTGGSTAGGATGATSGAAGAAQFGPAPSTMTAGASSMPGSADAAPPAPMGPIAAASRGTGADLGGGLITGSPMGPSPASVGQSDAPSTASAATAAGFAAQSVGAAAAAPNISASAGVAAGWTEAGKSASTAANTATSATASSPGGATPPASSNPANAAAPAAVAPRDNGSEQGGAVAGKSSNAVSHRDVSAAIGGAAPGAESIKNASQFGGDPVGLGGHAAEVQGLATESGAGSAGAAAPSDAGPAIASQFGGDPAGLEGHASSNASGSGEGVTPSTTDSASPAATGRGELPGPRHLTQALGHLVDVGSGLNPVSGSALAFSAGRSGDEGEGEGEGESGRPELPGNQGVASSLQSQQGQSPAPRGEDRAAGTTGSEDSSNRLHRAKQGAAAGFAIAGVGGAVLGAAGGATLAPQIDAVATKAKAALEVTKTRLGIGATSAPATPPPTTI